MIIITVHGQLKSNGFVAIWPSKYKRKRVILQELPNSCPQTLMSHYRFRFWNISNILCVFCRSICMCIFTILKLVISLKARKRFRFYSGKGSLFHVSLAQFCIFQIQSCNKVTSLWARVWHNMMHICLIHKSAQYDNFIMIFW